MQSLRRKLTNGRHLRWCCGPLVALNRATRILFSFAALALILLGGCSGRQSIRMQMLEDAPRAELILKRHVVMGDLESLGEIYRPLCPRLGMIQASSGQDWKRLSRVIPDLGPCPDFRRGVVVGIVSRAGTPLEGGWPIEIVDARVIRGAGYVTAEFRPGTYLADGIGYATFTQCGNIAAVLMVDVNGIRYFTD